MNGNGATPQLTGQDGCYSFPSVDCGEYTVELTLQQGYFATTPTVHEIQVCDCADTQAPPFGVAMASRNCDGHTPGYWRNKHGLKFINDNNLLPTLPALNLVDADGNYVAFASLAAYRSWLQKAEATNMAYMLSAHVVAMHLNVVSGFVDADCLVDGGSLGNISIADLLSQAIASLALYPYTPVGHPQRGAQEALKNALDAANNNLNWL